MNNYISSTADKIQASILNAYKISAQINEQADASDFVQVMESLCQLEQDSICEDNVIKNFECNSLLEFDTKSRKMLVDLKKNPANSKESSRYKKFIENIEDLQQAANLTQLNNRTQDQNATVVDGMEVQETENYIDPISKRPIVNPCRNNKCKHVYDRETITAAIQTNPRIRCPYLGCGNKERVRIENLVDDRELKRQILARMQQDEDEDMSE